MAITKDSIDYTIDKILNDKEIVIDQISFDVSIDEKRYIKNDDKCIVNIYLRKGIEKFIEMYDNEYTLGVYGKFEDYTPEQKYRNIDVVLHIINKELYIRQPFTVEELTSSEVWSKMTEEQKRRLLIKCAKRIN